ncbi:MAG: hypothetical protein KAH01_02190, partial [Caldisericia bacterium]|nr:hypothetical protein [Caldisericia bacterium]
IYIKETAMKESISINRKEIDTISHNRLWKSISIAVMVTTFAFGYLYLDIKHIMSKESMIISNQVEIKNEIIHINRSIKKFETIQNAQRNHTH